MHTKGGIGGVVVAASGSTTFRITFNPGGKGAITTGGIAASSIGLHWAAANDDGTQQDNLEYLVVYSAGSNIDTVSNAVYNGTVTKDWTANLTGATATGLSPQTTYYFNVVVRDE